MRSPSTNNGLDALESLQAPTTPHSPFNDLHSRSPAQAQPIEDPESPLGSSLPFPPLPEGWRYTTSRSNKYYFWQRGVRVSTYKHPVTGLEYSANGNQQPHEPHLSPGPNFNPSGSPASYTRRSNGFYDVATDDNLEIPFSPERPVPQGPQGVGSLSVPATSARGPEPRMSRRVLIEKLNEDYQNQRISQEEYSARWKAIFQNIQDEKSKLYAPPLSQPIEAQPDLRLKLSAPTPAPPVFTTAPVVNHRHMEVVPFTAARPSQDAWVKVPAGPKLKMSSSNASYYSSKSPDPAPHLGLGVHLPPPGPRINFNPPAPAQCAPVHDTPGVPQLPPPQPPAPMTFLAPPLRNGLNMSPPEGEVVTKHHFDFPTKTWRRDRIRIRLDKYPFQEGTLRSVFYMKDLSKPHGPAQDYVAKISKDPTDSTDAYFQDCEMQSLAGYLSELFVAMQIPKKCAYLEAAVIECHDRVSPTGGRVVFGVEPLFRGTFIKYTNNYGWINPGIPRNTPQAFSHFTHYVSAGTLVVVDIQGITDESGIDFYTDPQIHTRGDQPSFGRADLRDQGIRKFFETHECNSICHALGLPRPDAPGGKPSSILPPPNPNYLRELRAKKN